MLDRPIHKHAHAHGIDIHLYIKIDIDIDFIHSIYYMINYDVFVF